MIIEESINELKHLLQKKRNCKKYYFRCWSKKSYRLKKIFFFVSRCFKKMSKIEEVEPCYRFMKNIVPLILSIEERRFVLTDYSVSSDVFVISVNYDKSQFEHKIDEFVCNIIMEAQKSDLYSYHWKVNGPLCEEIEDPPLSYFDNSEIITFTVV